MIDRRQGIFDEYRWIISRLQWLLDGIVVVLMLFLICWIYGESFRLIFQVLGLVTFLLTIMVFRAAQLYQPWRGANFMRLVRRVFLAWLVIVAILMMLGYVSKTSLHFSRKVLLTWMVTVPVALVVLRLQVFWGLRWLRQQGRNSRTVVIAGAGDLGRRLAKNVVETPWLGMRLLGFFDDRVTGEIHLDHQSYPVLGTLDDMIGFVQQQQVVMVYLALPLRAEDRLRAGGGIPPGHHRLRLLCAGRLHFLPALRQPDRFERHTAHRFVGNPLLRGERLAEAGRRPGAGQSDPDTGVPAARLDCPGGEVDVSGPHNLPATALWPGWF